MLNLIKNVVFDLGKVLVKSYWYENMGKIGASKFILDKLKIIILESETWEEIDKGRISISEAIKKNLTEYPDLEEYIRCFYKFFPRYTVVNKSIEKFFIDLKKGGYKVYLLSNYGEDYFEQLFQKYEFLNFADGRVISYEVKVTKPDKIIYKELLDKYNLISDESIFIDDKYDNICTASKLGFHTIRYRNFNQLFKQFYDIVDSCNK